MQLFSDFNQWYAGGKLCLRGDSVKRKVRINQNRVGLVVFGIFLIGLLVLKNTLLVDFTINYPAVII